MLKKFFSSKNEAKESTFEALVKTESGPILKIVLGDLHLATLYFDGSRYCLLYHSDFLKAHIAPFNPEGLAKDANPEIDKCYYSDVLWHTFASRIPSAERPDFVLLMKSLGLTGSENPLLILSKIGSVSISKPWKLVLVKNDKVS